MEFRRENALFSGIWYFTPGRPARFISSPDTISQKSPLVKSGLLLFMWIILGAGLCAETQIDRFTIDGGGDMCSGGSYVMVGTIGQPDAAVVSGEDYVLNGGYWAGSCGCIVNLTDLSNFSAQWLGTGPGLAADLWADEVVDLEDLAELSWWWLQVCPADWPLK